MLGSARQPSSPLSVASDTTAARRPSSTMESTGGRRRLSNASVSGPLDVWDVLSHKDEFMSTTGLNDTQDLFPGGAFDEDDSLATDVARLERMVTRAIKALQERMVEQAVEVEERLGEVEKLMRRDVDMLRDQMTAQVAEVEKGVVEKIERVVASLATLENKQEHHRRQSTIEVTEVRTQLEGALVLALEKTRELDRALRQSWEDFNSEAALRWRRYENNATAHITRQMRVLEEGAITPEERTALMRTVQQMEVKLGDVGEEVGRQGIRIAVFEPTLMEMRSSTAGVVERLVTLEKAVQDFFQAKLSLVMELKRERNDGWRRLLAARAKGVSIEDLVNFLQSKVGGVSNNDVQRRTQSVAATQSVMKTTHLPMLNTAKEEPEDHEEEEEGEEEEQQ
jgi:hypothetical protein